MGNFRSSPASEKPSVLSSTKTARGDFCFTPVFHKRLYAVSKGLRPLDTNGCSSKSRMLGKYLLSGSVTILSLMLRSVCPLYIPPSYTPYRSNNKGVYYSYQTPGTILPRRNTGYSTQTASSGLSGTGYGMYDHQGYNRYTGFGYPGAREGNPSVPKYSSTVHGSDKNGVRLLVARYRRKSYVSSPSFNSKFQIVPTSKTLRSHWDENHDGVPDALDRNRDGKVDSNVHGGVDVKSYASKYVPNVYAANTRNSNTGNVYKQARFYSGVTGGYKYHPGVTNVYFSAMWPQRGYSGRLFKMPN